jgi:hypothetical protein
MQAVRRFVTGHDCEGKSIFLSAGEPPQHHHRTTEPVKFIELWNTSATPAPINQAEEKDPNERVPLRIPPDPGGTILRILDIYPGHLKHIAPRPDGGHPGMHRTETIDYGIMIEGELTMLLDDSEVTLRPGDVVIQRGTNYGWENRSETVTARIAFVIVDGVFTGDLADQLHGVELMHTTLPQKAEHG